MEHRYDFYERGLRALQERLSDDKETLLEVDMCKSRFLMAVQQLRIYGDNTNERAELNQVIDQLHRICRATVKMDFDDWTTHYVINELQQLQQDPLYPYLGDWQALQDGRLQEFLLGQLKKQGIVIQTQRVLPRRDPLERYKQVPLHAYLLYTSQDPGITPCILKHWDALETLSGNVYDISISVAQLQGQEDGHTLMENSLIIKQAGFQQYSLLPGLFFWDKKWNWEFLPFRGIDEDNLTFFWRFLYEQLKPDPSIATICKIKALLAGLGQNNSHYLADPLAFLSDHIDPILLTAYLRQFQPVPSLSLLPSKLVPSVLPASAPSTTIAQECQKLIAELAQTPPGNGPVYERLVEKILRICFQDEFSPFSLHKQNSSSNGKRRRDIIINNTGASHEFWQVMRNREGLDCLLVDAKNYKAPLAYREFTNTLRYLDNPAFGNLIILMTRQGVVDDIEILEDYVRKRRFILVLKDSDVIEMLKRKASGKSASACIQEHYSRLLLKK